MSTFNLVNDFFGQTDIQVTSATTTTTGGFHPSTILTYL